MTEQRFRIFVVDDDPVSQMIAVEQLDDPAYEVMAFGSGDECLAAMDQAPDLILMDVEMPGEDGISVCRSIRDEGNSHAVVVFVTGHDDHETRLAAYEAGGNDFIVKPIDPDEMMRKVRLAERFLQERHGLAQQAQFAQQAAFTAMSSLGEMGVVLQFLRASFNCETPSRLANTILEAVGQYGLQGIVEIRDLSGGHCFSFSGPCTPLEVAVLNNIRSMDRIFQFRGRMTVNYPSVTLLVSGLPLDDPDRVGRLRDHLALIAEGGDARVQAMESERLRLAQASGIVQAVGELMRVLEDIDLQQGQNRLRMLEAANLYLEEVESAFVHLGLTETQENELVVLAKRAIERFNQLQDDGKRLGTRLEQVTAALQQIVAAGQAVTG